MCKIIEAGMLTKRSFNGSIVFVSWRLLCGKYGSYLPDRGFLPVNKPVNHILGIARSRGELGISQSPTTGDYLIELSRGYKYTRPGLTEKNTSEMNQAYTSRLAPDVPSTITTESY